MTRSRLSRIFWISAATILVVAALIAIGAIVNGGFSDNDGRILGSLGSLLFAGGTAFAGLALVEQRKFLPLGWAAVATGAIGFALLVTAIWRDGGDTLGRFAVTALTLLAAMLLATTNRLLLRNSRLLPLWGSTVALLSVATLLTVAAIWNSVGSGSGLVKAIATFWILGILGWFLVPVLQRFTASARPEGPQEERVLAMLDAIEVLATARPREGDISVEPPALAPGERLVLRRRAG